MRTVETENLIVPVDQISYVVLKGDLAYLFIAGENTISVSSEAVKGIPFVAVNDILVNPKQVRMMRASMPGLVTIVTNAGDIRATDVLAQGLADAIRKGKR